LWSTAHQAHYNVDCSLKERVLFLTQRGIIYFLKHIRYRYPQPPNWGGGLTQYYFRRLHIAYSINTQFNNSCFRLLVWVLRAFLEILVCICTRFVSLVWVTEYSLGYVINNWYSGSACTLWVVGHESPPRSRVICFLLMYLLLYVTCKHMDTDMWLYNCVLLSVHMCLGL
jgi:hypothetical protein